MGEISNFGFQIYRLREAQENCEFLLYDVDNKSYYQYSYRRGIDMMVMLIEKILDMSLKTYMIQENYLDKDSKSIEYQTLLKTWIREDIKIIDNISYKPIDDMLYNEDGKLYFNTYQKSDLLKKELKASTNDFDHIHKIILNLCDNDEKGYKYLVKWLAWQIQNPLQRLATSIVFQGQQGSGKTLFCNYILKPIFDKNFIEINQGDLNAEYSEYIMGKQIIVANEVIYNEKKISSSERLKNLVSDDFVNIRRKYKDSLYLRNYSQWIFTSNNQVPIRIEAKDRRFSVFKSKTLENGVQFFQNFDKVKEEEVEAFLYYLKNIPVILNEINYPYKNKAKADIIEASLNSVELFIHTIQENGGMDSLNSEYEEDGTGWKNYLYLIHKKENSYIKLDCFYKLYQKFCNHAGIKNQFGRNGFTSMLKHLTYTITIIKDGENKSHRVMKLEGIEQ